MTNSQEEFDIDEFPQNVDFHPKANTNGNLANRGGTVANKQSEEDKNTLFNIAQKSARIAGDLLVLYTISKIPVISTRVTAWWRARKK